jgi:hypothetical protein
MRRQVTTIDSGSVRSRWQTIGQVPDPAIRVPEVVLVDIGVVDAINVQLAQEGIVGVGGTLKVLEAPCLVDVLIQDGARRDDHVDASGGNEIADDVAQAGCDERAGKT